MQKTKPFQLKCFTAVGLLLLIVPYLYLLANISHGNNDYSRLDGTSDFHQKPTNIHNKILSSPSSTNDLAAAVKDPALLLDEHGNKYENNARVLVVKGKQQQSFSDSTDHTQDETLADDYTLSQPSNLPSFDNLAQDEKVFEKYTNETDAFDSFDFDEFIRETEEDVMAKINLLVTVGIKTFNRPACALNLVKSILFYYPGISITIVNDGDQELVIDDTHWVIQDPALSETATSEEIEQAKKVSVDLVVRKKTIEDPQLFMQSQLRDVLPSVYDNRDISGGNPVSTITILAIPFDSGVSMGRNVLVYACETKYILMTDDDYEFLPETDLKTMMNLLEKSEDDLPSDSPISTMFSNSQSLVRVDIVGGIRTESKETNNAFPRGSNFELTSVSTVELSEELRNYNHLFANPAELNETRINMLRIKPSTENVTPRILALESAPEQAEDFAGYLLKGNCMPTEFIQQFFMARVETLRGTTSKPHDMLWDPHLKNNDHYDFFLRARQVVSDSTTGESTRRPTKASIIGCSSIKYQHAKQSNKACSVDTRSTLANGGAYMDFRNRWVQFIPYLFEKWNIGLVIDEEIGKTIIVSRDNENVNQCHVLELRKDPKKNKDYLFECETRI